MNSLTFIIRNLENEPGKLGVGQGKVREKLFSKSVGTLVFEIKATLKKKSVSGRPGGIKKDHPGGREILFFSEIFFFQCNLRIILRTTVKTV